MIRVISFVVQRLRADHYLQKVHVPWYFMLKNPVKDSSQILKTRENNNHIFIKDGDIFVRAK